MKKIMFLIVMAFVVLLVTSVAYSDDKIKECESRCLSLCSDKTDEAFNGCFKVCMDVCLKSKNPQKETMKLVPDVPPPTPVNPSPSKSDTEVQKTFTLCSSENYQEINAGTFLLALGEKLCCYDKGREIGRCHELTPYFNVLNGECYPTREACKESAGGYDFCFICAGKCPKS